MILIGILYAVNLMWSVWSLAYKWSTSDQSDEWKFIAVDNKVLQPVILTRVTN